MAFPALRGLEPALRGLAIAEAQKKNYLLFQYVALKMLYKGHFSR
jgi:hypothetical protein